MNTAPRADQNIRGSLLADIDLYMRRFGQDPAVLFDRLGLGRSGMDDPDLRIPVTTLMALLNECAALTGQEDFGLRIADWRRMPDIGPIAILLRQEDTLRGALRTLLQALPLHSNALYLTFDEADEAAILAMDVMTGAEGLSRQSAEMVVCALLHMVDWMVGPSWQPAFVGFRHAPKLPLATYRKYLRLTPDFRQEFNGVGIDRADLDRPIDHAKERLERQVTEFIDAMSDETELYVYRVRQLLVLTLPRGEAQADVIAGYLRTTRRTLNRRLARAGLNFSALLEQVRREMAVQYGKGSDRPFSEIALLLGFESLAAFSRWFRRAFGATPSAWRRQHAE